MYNGKSPKKREEVQLEGKIEGTRTIAQKLVQAISASLYKIKTPKKGHLQTGNLVY